MGRPRLCSAYPNRTGEIESSGIMVSSEMADNLATRGAIGEGKVATSVKMSSMPCDDSCIDCMLPLRCCYCNPDRA
jgi:hypothetical protein